MSGSAKRRNRSGLGSQASLGMNMNDELEMHEKSRPSSSHSRNAWSDDLLSGGHDEIDFSPRAPASAAVDLPSAMEGEPANHQTRVPTDVRAPGTKNVPVGCWTRFKRIIRGKNSVINICTTAEHAYMSRITKSTLFRVLRRGRFCRFCKKGHVIRMAIFLWASSSFCLVY